MTAYLSSQARRMEAQAAELAALLDGIGQAELPPMVAARAAVDLDKLAADLDRVAGRIADAGGSVKPDAAKLFQ